LRVEEATEDAYLATTLPQLWTQ